jgi:aspartate 1-decarboxylase
MLSCGAGLPGPRGRGNPAFPFGGVLFFGAATEMSSGGAALHYLLSIATGSLLYSSLFDSAGSKGCRVKRLILKSMIMGARVVQADLRYVGSITIDEDLIDKCNLTPNESVLVVDRTNGKRLETYVIKGERGSGMICMNGAAAHLINQGDTIDIMAFAWTGGTAQPLFIEVDSANRFVRYVEMHEAGPGA